MYFNLPSAHKTQVEFRSHFWGEKGASYGPGNTVLGTDSQHSVILKSENPGGTLCRKIKNSRRCSYLIILRVSVFV
jgi:hypothetical protein